MITLQSWKELEAWKWSNQWLL